MYMAMKRKYPVGIQSFESLRMDGYVYVDKTPLIYKMITEGKPYFLSRPRRFGKSLLVSTLAAVFEGRRELFEAFTTEQGIEQPQLFIAQSDWKWERYPVLRFDFSKFNLTSIARLDEYINVTLGDYEQQYGIPHTDASYSARMVNIIHTAERQRGKKVVIICDEYDNMMLHNLGNAAMQTVIRERFQDLFMPLKAEDSHLQFVFITGISKFSQMGIFSKLNNLENISMQPAYDTICGISEQELTTTMRPDIELMAEQRGQTYDAMLDMLKANYDGYHFSRGKTDVYNPFSLLKAIKSGEVDSYWFESGTTQALIDMLAQMPPIDMAEVEGIRLPSTAFDLPFETFDDPLPILYQSGYLTIKDCKSYDFDIIYTLGFPNAEVRRGFADCLFKHVAGKKINARQSSALQLAYYNFRNDGDLPAFIEALKVFFAGVPYMIDDKGEHHFHAMLYTLFVSFGADVVAEDLSSKGRADLTLKMPRGIYVMELKYNDTAEAALEQIDRKGYADKYALNGRPVTKVGIAFSSVERNITDWKAV